MSAPTANELHGYSRILIVGNAGAGKSFLARRLAGMTKLPLTHLDNEYWKPGWVKTPRDEWDARQLELTAGESWIIEGNYDRTMELRFAAAELVIFLDINRLVCIWGAARRTGKKRSDLPDYLDEPGIFGREFLDFCKLIWQYRKTGRKTVLRLRDKYPEVRFLHLRSRRAANNTGT